MECTARLALLGLLHAGGAWEVKVLCSWEKGSEHRLALVWLLHYQGQQDIGDVLWEHSTVISNEPW